jgi:hypothetical protein
MSDERWDEQGKGKREAKTDMSEKRKPYVFRPDDDDEGDVAFLTDSEYKQIQSRLAELQNLEDWKKGDEAFYIYEMNPSTFEKILADIDRFEWGYKLPGHRQR